MKAHVVIGANFGDEGKGLTTHHLCSKLSNAINIRFNGGAQAGHTVEIENGIRHVFKHFGSGTIANTPTYLSEHFIVNPIEFLKEHHTLTVQLDNFVDETYIHPRAKVTTPYDIIINWAMENRRREQANTVVHGSCGLGIHETVKRHNIHPVTVSDFLTPEILKTKLISIRSYYRSAINSNYLSKYIDEDYHSDEVLEDFIEQCRNVLGRIHIVDYKMLPKYENLVFEGAQGLLLDEDHKWFPHVTHSKTGLHNVEEILYDVGLLDVEVHYVTRSYLTRHGNGPLPNESDNVAYSYIDDQTNFDNHFQGKLRFAPVNIRLLVKSIKDDINQSTLNVKSTLVVTHFGCLPNKEFIEFSKHTRTYATPSELLKELSYYTTWSKIVTFDTPYIDSAKTLNT